MKAYLAYSTGALIAMAAITAVLGGSEQYADLVKIHGLLKTADDRLVLLSTKNCQSGSGFIDFCPAFSKDSLSDVIRCFFDTVVSGPTAKEVEIFFDSEFATKPNVAIFTSGLAYVFGTNFNITVAKVSRTSFTVQATGLPAPFTVRFNYVACDQKMLFHKAYLDIQEEIAFYSDT